MINLNKEWKKDAINHAVDCYPEECCGIVAIKDNKEFLWKCKNISYEFKATSFVIDPEDWADCEDSVDEIVGILHSHPDNKFEFSETDKISCKTLDLTFYLVEPASDRIIKLEPSEVIC